MSSTPTRDPAAPAATKGTIDLNDARPRRWGWLLLLAGVTITIVGVLANLQIYFRPTSLFNTLMMLALLAGGIGLLARSLRAAESALKDKETP